MAKKGSECSFSDSTQSSLCWWAPWTPICNPAPTPHFLSKKKEINKRKPLGWAVVPLAFLLGESRGGRDQDKL